MTAGEQQGAAAPFNGTPGSGLGAGMIAWREVSLPGGVGKFFVRGATTDDIVSLFRRRAVELEGLYNRLAVLANPGNGDGLNLDQTKEIGNTLLTTSPAILAEIIAVASGASIGELDEQTAIARLLPVGVQVAAFEAIAELTFTSEMPPGKFLETVLSAMGGLGSLIANSVPQLSQNGSGNSAEA